MKLLKTLAVLLAILASCGREQEGLPFFIPEEGGPAGQRLEADQDGGFSLAEPVLVARDGRAFYIRYRGAGGGESLRVYGGGGRQVAAGTLVRAGEEVVTQHLSLPRGSVIRSFKIEKPADREQDLPALELLEAGLGESFDGIRMGAGLMRLGGAVRAVEQDGSALEVFFQVHGWPFEEPAVDREAQPSAASRFSGATGQPPAAAGRPSAAAGLGGSAAAGQGVWQVAVTLDSRAPFSWPEFRSLEAAAESDDRLRPPGVSSKAPPDRRSSPKLDGGRANVLLTFRFGGETAVFRHGSLPGTQTIYLYEAMVPFRPQSLRLEPLGGGALRLRSLTVSRLGPTAVSAAGESAGGSVPAERSAGSLDPLPADPGAVLLYDPARWRQADFELFSWSRFPRILIMDTADYGVQSRLFKRLAFFVEKRGYRGRLVSNQDFAGLHGFNAHDYRAEDLAGFFQKAREESFTLNREEELLKELLLHNGVIREEQGFLPGTGAILSISRSSYPVLRRHLLTHESYHGVFFSRAEYRQACREEWESLPAPAREFWLLFFRWMGYDTADSYLVVNEFQAYLFQQPRPAVQYYFRSLTAGRLISAYPDRAPEVRRFLRSDPGSFLGSFDRLERSLRETAGVEGGRVVDLEPAGGWEEE
jgi:hypothetical protein